MSFFVGKANLGADSSTHCLDFFLESILRPWFTIGVKTRLRALEKHQTLFQECHTIAFEDNYEQTRYPSDRYLSLTKTIIQNGNY